MNELKIITKRFRSGGLLGGGGEAVSRDGVAGVSSSFINLNTMQGYFGCLNQV